jgi:hypothetical protein
MDVFEQGATMQGMVNRQTHRKRRSSLTDLPKQAGMPGVVDMSGKANLSKQADMSGEVDLLKQADMSAEADVS